MNTSNNNHLNILDLPNEILLKIFNKLNMVDVLYSLVDVNKRFDQLLLNPLYIRHLDMTIKSCFDRTSSIDNQVLNRVCFEILPRIHQQIKQLTLESHSMKSILLAVNYPELYSLSLINFQEEILLQYLTEDDSILYDILTKQITHLKIDIEKQTTTEELSETRSNIFVLILSSCKQLINLNFCQLFHDRKLPVCIYMFPSTSCMSSTLIKLKINVETFHDCLYLLDGRLDCLSTLIIHVKTIVYSKLKIGNMKKLLKLKCFSLTSLHYIFHYDNLILPLLRRMINLEELVLFLSVIRRDSTYIDGTELHNEILIHMPRLNKFTFSINTGVLNEHISIDLPSYEDIQYSFIEKGYTQVDSYVHTISMKTEGRCHVYSLPYQFKDFLYLNNSFQGSMFDKVQSMAMYDTRPFEHKFFKLVSENFPRLKNLYICNDKPQKDKENSSTLITFVHLTLLNLDMAHVDYAEQFLFEKKTHLPRLLNLGIGYESLAMVTNNFTNDETRVKCAKLKSLEIDEPFVRPENFYQYFPLL